MRKRNTARVSIASLYRHVEGRLGLVRRVSATDPLALPFPLRAARSVGHRCQAGPPLPPSAAPAPHFSLLLLCSCWPPRSLPALQPTPSHAPRLFACPRGVYPSPPHPLPPIGTQLVPSSSHPLPTCSPYLSCRLLTAGREQAAMLAAPRAVSFPDTLFTCPLASLACAV